MSLSKHQLCNSCLKIKHYTKDVTIEKFIDDNEGAMHLDAFVAAVYGSLEENGGCPSCMNTVTRYFL